MKNTKEMTTTELFNYFHDNYKEIFRHSFVKGFCAITGLDESIVKDCYWNGAEIPNNDDANEAVLEFLKPYEATKKEDCKNKYIEKYVKKINYLVKKYTDLRSFTPETDATIEFEKTATVDEVVGFYLCNEGKNALKQWRKNIEGFELRPYMIEITNILENLGGN